MIIKGNILNENFEFHKGEVHIENDKITEIIFNDNIIEECYIVPGFIDTHMHGAMGKEFFDCNPDAYKIIGEFEAKNGTTSLVPAISAAPKEQLIKCAKYMKQLCETEIDGAAKIYGVHMEGPFFSESCKGAHRPENIRNCDIDEFKEIYENCGGFLKIMTLAPELPGAEQVVKFGSDNGVVMSAGHTGATCDEIKQSVNWGISAGTHLFNAMSPLKHREPGAVGGLLYENNVKCELICDFYHVRPEVIKLVYAIKGRDKINMITDSISGAGLSDGEYTLSGNKIIVKNGEARLPDGTICGGSTCLIDGVRNLVSIGIPLSDACMMASKNPAQSAGIYDTVGSMQPGKIADIVILDKELNIKNVIVRGKII